MKSVSICLIFLIVTACGLVAHNIKIKSVSPGALKIKRLFVNLDETPFGLDKKYFLNRLRQLFSGYGVELVERTDDIEDDDEVRNYDAILMINESKEEYSQVGWNRMIGYMSLEFLGFDTKVYAADREKLLYESTIHVTNYYGEKSACRNYVGPPEKVNVL
ncbi:MAG: hypothetical protein LHV69_04350 [Elusimicrobia bacterium]|nr:hypothetical protein [Candidatus Obscuribacterium magneticum]